MSDELDPQKQALLDQVGAWAINNLTEMISSVAHHLITDDCLEIMCVGNDLSAYIATQLDEASAKLLLSSALVLLARANIMMAEGAFSDPGFVERVKEAMGAMGSSPDLEDTFKKILEEHDEQAGH